MHYAIGLTLSMRYSTLCSRTLDSGIRGVDSAEKSRKPHPHHVRKEISDNRAGAARGSGTDDREASLC